MEYVLKNEWNEKQWKIERAPRGNKVLFMRLTEDGKTTPGEVYPITYCDGVKVVNIRQTGDDEFIYDVEDRTDMIQRRWFYRMRLKDGTKRHLERRMVHKEQAPFYTESGEKLISVLLEKNNFEETEPVFGECDLFCVSDFDRETYELVDARDCLILRERASGNFCLEYERDERIGFRQYGKNEFLALYRTDDDEFYLRHYKVIDGCTKIVQNVSRYEPTPFFFSYSDLALVGLNCQLPGGELVGRIGIYRPEKNCLDHGPYDVLRMVAVRGKDRTPEPMMVIAGKDYVDRPSLLSLYDPIKKRLVGKSLNLFKMEMEKSPKTMTDFYARASRIPSEWLELQRQEAKTRKKTA